MSADRSSYNPARPGERKPTRYAVADNLRELRLARGWSVDEMVRRYAELPRYIGLPSWPAMIERRDAYPNIEDLDAFAELFGVEPADLVAERRWPLQDSVPQPAVDPHAHT